MAEKQFGKAPSSLQALRSEVLDEPPKSSSLAANSRGVKGQHLALPGPGEALAGMGFLLVLWQ